MVRVEMLVGSGRNPVVGAGNVMLRTALLVTGEGKSKSVVVTVVVPLVKVVVPSAS